MTRLAIPLPSSRLCFSLAAILCIVLGSLPLHSQQDAWRQHMQAGDKAVHALKYAKAAQEYQAAVTAAQVFQPNDLRTAEALGKLGEIDVLNSQFPEAEDALKRAASITEAAASPNDPRLAYALIHQALVYERELNPGLAAPLWDRSIPILVSSAKSTNPANPADAAILNDMQGVAMNLRWKETQPARLGEDQIYSAILKLREAQSAANPQSPNPDLKSALSSLAILYEQTGRFSDAEPLRTRILALDEKDFGPESARVAGDSGSLAELYEDQGKYEAALPLLKRKLEITETINQPDPPEVKRRKDRESTLATLLMIPQIPVLLASQGAIGYLPGLPIQRPNQDEITKCYRELARGYANAGKFPEAEAMFKEIIAVDEKSTAPEQKYKIHNMDLDADLIDLSRLYRTEHRYEEALKTIARSQTVSESIANSKSEQQKTAKGRPPIYPWLSEIERAEIYREMGDTTAATPAFEHSLEMAGNLEILPGNPKLAEFLDHYATLLRDEGKYDRSEELYKRALDSWAKTHWEQTRPATNPAMAGTLTNYASLLRKVDRPAEAQALEERASVIQAKAGTSNPVIWGMP